MKAHYTISLTVPKGQGDYGSESKCVFDARTTRAEAEQLAQSMANLMRAEVMLFKGKNLGKLVAQWQPQAKADLSPDADTLQTWITRSNLARFG